MTSNEKLYTQVMEKLSFNPRLDVSNLAIAIQGNQDIVLLEGIVNSLVEKLTAVSTVKDIQVVRAVVDVIKVEPSVKYKRSDPEIDASSTKALEENVYIPYNNIKLVVNDGYIILSCEVEWQYQKIIAENAVKNLWG